jgi:hypothetical protein
LRSIPADQEFQFLEHAAHLAVELGAHAIALFRAIEPHPGDSVLDGIGNSICFGTIGHGFNPSMMVGVQIG